MSLSTKLRGFNEKDKHQEAYGCTFNFLCVSRVKLICPSLCHGILPLINKVGEVGYQSANVEGHFIYIKLAMCHGDVKSSYICNNYYSFAKHT